MADINLTAEQVAALILSIGDKSKLKTADKQTIVDAINEVIDSNLAPTSVLYTPMNLSNESKAQARENIGAVSAEDLEVKQTFLPIARGQSIDGISYVATDADSGTVLPIVSVANSAEQISAEGKGRQIVFIPYVKNKTTAPTLQINGGEVIPIRLRAPCNQGADDAAPSATLPVPVGALMRGVPYTMTFCGKYWLVDSLIDLHPEAVPLYIRGTYDTQANTFTPDVDYTVQEISDAVSAGRYVALVVDGEYIVPCVECSPHYCIFSLLLISDILNITEDYINIRIGRDSRGWSVDTFQIP